MNSQSERIRMYKAAFDQFSVITQNTIRKLIGHLHFIKSQSSKNLMNIENLASVWGPTLMHYEVSNIFVFILNSNKVPTI